MSMRAIEAELESLARQALLCERRAGMLLELLGTPEHAGERRAAAAVELASYDLRLSQLALSAALAELRRANAGRHVDVTGGGC